MAVPRVSVGVLVVIVCGAMLAPVTGCRHSGPPKRVVSGTVSYEGKTVDAGEIRFIPTKSSTGPVCIADIAAGKYRADHDGGVIVGINRVEIFAYRADPKYKNQAEEQRPSAVGFDGDWPPKEQYLPAKYNMQSELEVSVEPGSGEIHKDFTLVP